MNPYESSQIPMNPHDSPRLSLRSQVLAGVNTDEGSLFTYPFLPLPLPAAEYTQHVRHLVANLQALRVDGGEAALIEIRDCDMRLRYEIAI